MSKDTFVKSTPQKGNFHPHETPPVPYQNNFYSPLSAFRKFIVINKNSICRTTDFSPAIYARTVSNSNVTPMRIPCHLMKYCLTEAPRLAPTPFDGAMRQCLQRASRRVFFSFPFRALISGRVPELPRWTPAAYAYAHRKTAVTVFTTFFFAHRVLSVFVAFLGNCARKKFS